MGKMGRRWVSTVAGCVRYEAQRSLRSADARSYSLALAKSPRRKEIGKPREESGRATPTEHA